MYELQKHYDEVKGIVITPRTSPRLYLGDAQEHYRLNMMLEMDEWKE